MKNAEQLLDDIQNNKEVAQAFRDGLNKLRGDEALSVLDAGLIVARELGYELGEDEAKGIIASLQRIKEVEKKDLSDEDLEMVAGGSCISFGWCICRSGY